MSWIFRLTTRICSSSTRLLRRSYSLWQRSSFSPEPSGINVLYGLIGVNAAVFVCWHSLSPAFMTRHFTTSIPNLQEGRLHTIITHAFSHYDIVHMGSNLIAMYFFGRTLGTFFNGRQVRQIYHIAVSVQLVEQMLNLYLAGALGSATLDLLWKATMSGGVIRKPAWQLQGIRDRVLKGHIRDAPSLGASGAVNAIAILFCCLFPKEIIYVNLFIPVPAFLLAILFIAYDFSSLNSGDSVSHAGHLGGLAVGLAYYAKIRYRGWR